MEEQRQTWLRDGLKAQGGKALEVGQFYRLVGKDGKPFTGGLGGVYSGDAIIAEVRADTPKTRRELVDTNGFPIDGWVWSF